MATIERDVVLMGRDGENNTIDLPITRLGNIEPTSEDKASLDDADMIPVLDSADAQSMKKITWKNLLAVVQKVFAAISHVHSTGDITSGTLPVSRGGTGAASLTSGCALIGNGTSAVAGRAITDLTSTASALTANTNLITANTLRYMMNRTGSVAAANTSYSTLMARGSSLHSAETSPSVNGAIAWQYE